MGRLVVVLGLLVSVAGCGFDGTSPTAPHGTRVSKLGDTVVISESDPNFRRYELPESAGECAMDVDCSSAGCSAEVCTTSKEAPQIFTTCSEEHPGTNFYCGCVATRCRWYVPPAAK